VLCDSDTPSVELERAKKEGVHGYISKSTKRHGLVTAIKRILSEISIEAAPIVVDAQARGEHLEHYWSFGVGAGRVNEGLRAAWHEHLVRANSECGFLEGTKSDYFRLYKESALAVKAVHPSLKVGGLARHKGAVGQGGAF
jgi:hypothetical protein